MNDEVDVYLSWVFRQLFYSIVYVLLMFEIDGLLLFEFGRMNGVMFWFVQLVWLLYWLIWMFGLSVRKNVYGGLLFCDGMLFSVVGLLNVWISEIGLVLMYELIVCVVVRFRFRCMLMKLLFVVFGVCVSGVSVLLVQLWVWVMQLLRLVGVGLSVVFFQQNVLVVSVGKVFMVESVFVQLRIDDCSVILFSLMLFLCSIYDSIVLCVVLYDLLYRNLGEFQCEFLVR